MKIIRLAILEFDGSENDICTARRIAAEKYFLSSDACVKFMDENKPENTYKGWDGQEYPQYNVTLIDVIEE